MTFSVDLGGDGEAQPTLENNDDENEATDDAAGVSGDTLQLLALVVVALGVAGLHQGTRALVPPRMTRGTEPTQANGIEIDL